MRLKETLVIFVAALMPLCYVGGVDAKEYKFKPNPDQYYYLFGGGKPVLTVAPGDRVVLWCEDALNGKVKTTKDIHSKVFMPGKVNPQTGPIYVEGVEPGDTLVLRIVDIQPSVDQAWSGFAPNFGFMSQTGFTRLLHDPLPEYIWIYPLDRDKGTATFISRLGKEKYTAEIPLHPFVGTIGTAPALDERMISLTPYFHGGNMDCVDTAVGATVYLPVNVPGAMWSTGDIHLAQGDGETCGIAIESEGWVTIDVLPPIKGKRVRTPRLENDEYIMSVGSARPLDDAMRIAYGDMVDWLVEEYGFDKWDAYQLMSQVCPVRVGNVVDTYYSIVVKFPKKYLPKK